MNNNNSLIASLGLAAMLIACNKEGMEPITADNLAGTWNFSSAKVRTVTQTAWYSDPPQTEILDTNYVFSDSAYQIVFNADMSYSVNLPDELGGGTTEGTWSISGKSVIRTPADSWMSPDTASVSISGKILTAEMKSRSEESYSGYTEKVDRTITAALNRR